MEPIYTMGNFYGEMFAVSGPYHFFAVDYVVHSTGLLCTKACIGCEEVDMYVDPSYGTPFSVVSHELLEDVFGENYEILINPYGYINLLVRVNDDPDSSFAVNARVVRGDDRGLVLGRNFISKMNLSACMGHMMFRGPSAGPGM